MLAKVSIKVLRDKTWHKVETALYDFSYLNNEKKQRLVMKELVVQMRKDIIEKNKPKESK